MLVCTYTGRQNLGNIVVGNSRETPVDGSGGIGIPFIGNRSERHDKGKGSVFVVQQVSFVVAGFDAAEGKRYTTGKTDGKDGRGIGFAKGNQTGTPADLNTVFNQQFGHILALSLVMHEDVQVLFLQLQGNSRGNFFIRRSTHNSSKTGSGSIDELDPAFTEDDVIGSTQP